MPWTINAEIYPLWARSTCNSIATSTNWFFNFLVSMTFLTLTEILTRQGTMIIRRLFVLRPKVPQEACRLFGAVCPLAFYCNRP